MITPRRLFWIRLKDNAKQQLRAWNSVFDWTVWLYLLIPAVIIFGGLYAELWVKMPEWAMSIPWASLYPFVLVVILLHCRVRVFVEEADRLFLLQRPLWLQALKRYGILYTLASSGAVMAILYAAVLPFLMKTDEGLSLIAIILSYMFSIGFGMATALSKHLLVGRIRGWLRRTAAGIGMLGLAAVYLFSMLTFARQPELLVGSIGVFILINAMLLRLVIKANILFELEVKNEAKARLKSTELIMSQVIESQPILRFKKPTLFRRSQRLFRASDAGTMLAEMRLKGFLRALTQLRAWIGYIIIAAYAISLVPIPVGVFLIFVITMLGSSWLHMQWNQWFAEAFIAQFPWPEEGVKKAISLSRLCLIAPAVLLWAAVLCIKFIN